MGKHVFLSFKWKRAVVGGFLMGDNSMTVIQQMERWRLLASS